MREAKAGGMTRYFTGKPCPRGHIAERLVSTRSCSVCASERKKAWNDNNPEKRNAQKRAWRSANLEKARALNLANQKKHRAAANARNQRYAETHREQLRTKNAAYDKANPHLCAAKQARRRAALLRATPPWAEHEAINGMYWLASVFRSTGLDTNVDHVIPLQGRNVCGLHVADNLQLLNGEQNRVKSNKTLQGVL